MKKWLLISLAVAVLLVLAGGGWAARAVRPGAGADSPERRTP
jgi:hypothetical protein